MMTRGCRRWLVPVAVLLGAWGVGEAQPPALVTLYEELRVAIEAEDAAAISTHLAPAMQLQDSTSGGWLQELSALFAAREGIAAEMRFTEQQIVGPKALLVVTWALSGRTAETGAPWSETHRRLDYLVQKGPRWGLHGSDPLAPGTAMDAVRDGRFVSPEGGLECTPPIGWRLFGLQRGRVCLRAWSPDLEAGLSWALTDLPGAFTAEQLVRAQQDAEAKLAPTLGLELRDASLEPGVLGNRPAFRLRRTLVGPPGTELHTDATYCVVGSALYLCTRTAATGKARGTHEAALDAAVASTRIIEAATVGLPPEAGRVEASKYVNETHGCEITAPPGWTVKVGQGRFGLQVTLCEPVGDSSLSLGMIRLPEPAMTAETAVVGDDAIASHVFDGYELIRHGETRVGDRPAYESVTAFDLGGRRRQRQRVYVVDGERLFFMFADAVPAESWARLAPLFEETFRSFRLTKARLPQ